MIIFVIFYWWKEYIFNYGTLKLLLLLNPDLLHKSISRKYYFRNYIPVILSLNCNGIFNWYKMFLCESSFIDFTKSYYFKVDFCLFKYKIILLNYFTSFNFLSLYFWSNFIFSYTKRVTQKHFIESTKNYLC